MPKIETLKLKIWNKYSQKRNIKVSVLISTFMCLWANYIFPRWVCLFCFRKYVDQSWEYINRSQTHKCGNWGWGRAIPRKVIYKRNCRCSVVVSSSCLLLPVSWFLPLAPCLLLFVSCLLSQPYCLLFPSSCFLPPAPTHAFSLPLPPHASCLPLPPHASFLPLPPHTSLPVPLTLLSPSRSHLMLPASRSRLMLPASRSRLMLPASRSRLMLLCRSPSPCFLPPAPTSCFLPPAPASCFLPHFMLHIMPLRASVNNFMFTVRIK